MVLCSAYASYKYDVRVRDCDAFVVRSADFTELKTIVRKILSYKRLSPVRSLRPYKNQTQGIYDARGFAFLMTRKLQ